MKSLVVVTTVVIAIVGTAFILASLSASDNLEPSIFTDPATVTAGMATATIEAKTPTPVAGTEETPTPTPTTGGQPVSAPYFPPVSIEMSIGDSGRFVLSDGTSRNVKLVATELVYSVEGLTVWGTATIEVSGPDLEPITRELSVAYLDRPVIIHDVRIWVAMTKHFNDGNLRDGGAVVQDARLVLSDARLPLTDPDGYAWPFGNFLWQEGGINTYYQGIQGEFGENAFHHGAIDLGMPRGTPVYAWTTGVLEILDRGFDYRIDITGTPGGIFDGISFLHLQSLDPDANSLNGQIIQKGTLIGYSGEANWYHTHIIGPYEFGPILGEWYMRDATPERESYIKDWLVAGPFFNEDDGLRLQTDYIGEGTLADPELGQPPVADYEWLYWDNLVPGVVMVAEPISPFPYSGLTDTIDNIPTGTSYMATYVNSPEEMNVVLNVGASDAIKVWVGNEVVMEEDSCIAQNGEREGEEPEIFIDQLQVNVSLEEGWNRLLVKTSQRDGCPKAWSLSVRFSDAQGLAVDGLTVDPLKGGTPPEPISRPHEGQLALFGIDPATLGQPSVQTPQMPQGGTVPQ